MAQAELAARKLQRSQLLPPAPCSLAVSVRARVAVGLRYNLTEALVEAGEAAAGLEVGSRFAGTGLQEALAYTAASAPTAMAHLHSSRAPFQRIDVPVGGVTLAPPHKVEQLRRQSLPNATCECVFYLKS